MELVKVTKENLGDWGKQLKDVGLHRRRTRSISK